MSHAENPAVLPQKFYAVEYVDAGYLYAEKLDPNTKEISAPSLLTTVASSMGVHKDSKSCVLSAGKNKYRFVIPLANIKKVTEIEIKTQDDISLIDVTDTYKATSILDSDTFKNIDIGNTISIKWNDMRFTQSDSTMASLTPMYLEGVYIGNKDEYVFVEDPENLNVEKVINHPEKKVDIYATPFAMIESIEVIDKDLKPTKGYIIESMDTARKNLNVAIAFGSDGSIECGFKNNESELFATLNGVNFIDHISSISNDASMFVVSKTI